jgi:hypothetical protein
MTTALLIDALVVGGLAAAVVLGIRAGKRRYDELGRIADERLGQEWRSRPERSPESTGNPPSETGPESNE